MIYPLKGVVQYYEWGGTTFIADFLGQPPSAQPQAEYWLGAHPKAPAYMTEEKVHLDVWLRGRGLRLPFLLKILDARQMLSIQVHPNKVQAEKGFSAENALGIPLDAAHRLFKDDNHKPEMMLALSDFYLLSGFREARQMSALLGSIPSFQVLGDYFGAGDYKRLYYFIMQADAAQTDALLLPHLAYLAEKGLAALPKEGADYWALKAWQDLDQARRQHIDKGIFSIYLLNLIVLKQGQTYFHDAGILHAYLQGQCVELMANSDNVLRGGLTSKHINIDALLRHTRYESWAAALPEPEPVSVCGETAYPCQAADFALHTLTLSAGVRHILAPKKRVTVYLVLEGRGSVCSQGIAYELRPSFSFLTLPDGVEAVIMADAPLYIVCATQP